MLIVGVTVAIVNNVAVAFISKMADKIKFAFLVNRHAFELVNIFLITYLNTSMFQSAFVGLGPFLFSGIWFKIFTKKIVNSMILTNLFYYIIAFVKIIIKVTIVLIKRCLKPEDETLKSSTAFRSDSTFSFERRYG